MGDSFDAKLWNRKRGKEERGRTQRSCIMTDGRMTSINNIIILPAYTALYRATFTY